MKKTILTIIGILALTLTNAQTYGSFTLLVKEKNDFLYTRSVNNYGSDKSPDLTVMYSGKLFNIRIDGAYLFKWDESANDFNSVTISFIFDNNKSSLMTYTGDVRGVDNEYKSRVYVDPSQKKSMWPIIEAMRKANFVHIKIKGGTGDGYVFKFDLNGFTAGSKKLFSKTLSSNPFSNNTNSDNPFKG